MEGGTVVPAAEQVGLGVHRRTGGRGREPQGYRILAWEGKFHCCLPGATGRTAPWLLGPGVT